MSTPDWIGLPGEWREVPGYGGLLWASSEGLIHSYVAGRLLSPFRTHGGYHRVTVKPSLGSSEGQKHYRVARLVAMAFHGLPPDARCQVDHLNGCRTDDRAVNLQWVTPSENTKRGHARRSPESWWRACRRRSMTKLTKRVRTWIAAHEPARPDVDRSQPVRHWPPRDASYDDLWPELR